MRVLGVRCSNTDFCFALLEGTKNNPILKHKSTIHFPTGYSMPYSLKWFRQEMAEILRKNEVDIVAIKCAEALASKNKQFVDRAFYEGVVMLASAENNIRTVHRKVKSSIAKDLGLKGRAKYLATDLDLTKINGLATFGDKEKEATLVAWSALP